LLRPSVADNIDVMLNGITSLLQLVGELGFKADQVHMFHCSWDSYTTLYYPQALPVMVPVVSSHVLEIFEEMQLY